MSKVNNFMKNVNKSQKCKNKDSLSNHKDVKNIGCRPDYASTFNRFQVFTELNENGDSGYIPSSVHMFQTNASGVNQSQNNVILIESNSGSITVTSQGGLSDTPN